MSSNHRIILLLRCSLVYCLNGIIGFTDGSNTHKKDEEEEERRVYSRTFSNHHHHHPSHYKTIYEILYDTWTSIDTGSLVLTIGIIVSALILQCIYGQKVDNKPTHKTTTATPAQTKGIYSPSKDNTDESLSSTNPTVPASSPEQSSRTITEGKQDNKDYYDDRSSSSSDDEEEEEEANPPLQFSKNNSNDKYNNNGSSSNSSTITTGNISVEQSISQVNPSFAATISPSSLFATDPAQIMKKSTFLRLPKDIQCQDIFEWDTSEGGKDHIGTGSTCLVFRCRLRNDRPSVWDQYWASKRRGSLPSRLCVKVYNENSLRVIDAYSIDPKIIKRELKSMMIAPHPHIVQIIHVFLVMVPPSNSNDSATYSFVQRATRFQSVYVIQEYAPGVPDIITNLQGLNPLQRSMILKKGGGGSELYRYLYKRRKLDSNRREIPEIGLPEVPLKYTLAQILLGIMALHERKIPLMHRDIKPENLVVVLEYLVKVTDKFDTTTEVKIPFVKLMDFGFARSVPLHTAERHQKEDENWFHTGLLGSGQYIAPEIVQYEMDDGRRLSKEDDSELDGFKHTNSSDTPNPSSMDSRTPYEFSESTGTPPSPMTPTRSMHQRLVKNNSSNDGEFLTTNLFHPVQNQIFIAKYGIKCDIYSLGILLYFSATLEKTRSVFTSPGGINDDPFAARRINRVLSPEGQALFWRMVALNPNDRPSARECLQSPWFNDIRESFAVYFNNRILIDILGE